MRMTMFSTLTIIGMFLLPTSTPAFNCGTTTARCSPGYYRECIFDCKRGMSLMIPAAAADEIPDKYKPIVAATRIFTGRFPELIYGRHVGARPGNDGNAISVVDSETAAIGSDFTVVREKDDACAFDVRRGSLKVAEIHFDLLSADYSTSPYGGGMVQLSIPGKDGALCVRLGNPDNGDFGCMTSYEAVVNPMILDVVLRSFRYIFAHVCAPFERF